MLKSTILFNTEVATSFGTAKFDHNGESNNLTLEAQKALNAVPYLTFVDDTPKKEEVKEEAKEEKPKAKKAPAKKATAKKTEKE